MSRRRVGPKVGSVLVGPCAGPRSTHVGAGDDDRAGATVVADREVPPVGQQRLGVRPEDPADVGGVVERAVEVDVVGDLERHRHRRPRRRPRGAAPRGRARASSVSNPTIQSRTELPVRPAQRQQRVEAGRSKTCATSSISAAATGARSSTGRRCGRRPAGRSSSGGTRRGQVVDVVRRARRALDPAPASWRTARDRRGRSSGSATAQEPNGREPPPGSRRVGSPRAGREVSSVQDARDLATVPPSSRPGGEQHVEEAVVPEARAPARCRTAWCSPAVHLNGISRSRAASCCRQLGRRRERVGPGPPVRNFRWYPEAAISSSAARHPAAGSPPSCGSSTYTTTPSGCLPSRIVDRDPPARCGRGRPRPAGRSRPRARGSPRPGGAQVTAGPIAPAPPVTTS